MRKWCVSVSLATVVAASAVPTLAHAFTQESIATPIGHEFITNVAAYRARKVALESDDKKDTASLLKRELAPGPKVAEALRCRSIGRTLKGAREAFAAAHDGSSRAADVPAVQWPLGGYGCDRTWGAVNLNVASIILGQQWVDTMGFVLHTDKTGGLSPDHASTVGITKRYSRCFDSVAQEQEIVQEDHFLRRRVDRGADGRASAHQRSVDRIRTLYLAAVSAGKAKFRNGRLEEEDIQVVAGGDFIRVYQVQRVYFLLGLALHPFEDSFSPEHAVRTEDFRQVVDVASYTCNVGAPGHTHSAPLDIPSVHNTLAHENHDVIWTGRARYSDPSQYKPTSVDISHAGHTAIAATEFFLQQYFGAVAGRVSPERSWEAIEKSWLRLVKDPSSVTYKKLDSADAIKCRRGIKSNPEVNFYAKQCLKQTGESTLDLMPNRPSYFWGGLLTKPIADYTADHEK